MKRFCSLSSVVVLIVSCILFSCKKEISPSETELASSNVAQTALTSTTGDCTPGVLGVHSVHRNGTDPNWITAMQRFYDPSGTLTNLKVYMPVGDIFYGLHLKWIDMPWGNVTYHGNQVYLTDVLKNKLLLRVTLNDNGLPEASYYYGEYPPFGNAPSPGPVIDTTYYYYTGNRLDYIFNIHAAPHLGSHSSAIRNFQYDVHGNIEVISGNNQGDGRIWIEYDYNKPITGIITTFDVTQPMKLLEYMGLLNLPMSYQPTKIISGSYQPGSALPHETYPALEYLFNNVTFTEGGQVYSYSHRGPSSEYFYTYYTGWNCLFFPPPGARMSNVIGELQDFQKQFPINK